MSVTDGRVLEGKVALVTGGSRGMGAAIARELASQGANVAITYATNAEAADEVLKAIRAHNVKGEAFKADQADPVQVDRMVKAVVQKMGMLDIVVNSAGISAH